MPRPRIDNERQELLPDTKEHQIYFKFIFFGLLKFTTSKVNLEEFMVMFYYSK